MFFFCLRLFFGASPQESQRAMYLSITENTSEIFFLCSCSFLRVFFRVFFFFFCFFLGGGVEGWFRFLGFS